jgi:hypothetical protein
MAKKRKYRKMTAEEEAERDLHQEWVRERIAYHEAKAREQEAARERAQQGWLRRRLGFGRGL